MLPHKRVVLIESTEQKTDPDMTSRRNDENILKGIVQETKKRFEMPENQNEANGRETPQIARSPKLTPRDTFTRNDAGQASVGLSVPQKDKYNVGVPMEPREVKHLTQPADEDKEFDLKNLKGNVDKKKKNFDTPGNAAGAQPDRQVQHQFQAGNQNQAKGRETPQTTRSPELTPKNNSTRNDANRKLHQGVLQVKEKQLQDPREAGGGKKNSAGTEKKMEERLKAEIQGSQEAIKKLLDEKLNGFQTQSEAQLRNQIERLTAELSCIDQKVSQEKERNLQNVDSMQFAIRDELRQQLRLLEKKFSTSEPNPEISRMEMKLDQLEKSEKKMEERLKAEIQGSQEAIKKLLDEKLNGFQTQSEAQLRNQIEQLTAELSCIDQKVSKEKERNLQTVDSMQFAIRDELQQQIRFLDKKFSTSVPNPEISRMEMKLDQLEKSEKKMEEQLKAEIQGSQEAIKKLLDEKLNGFQTQSEVQLRNQIERLTAELSCIDQKVSQEKERNLQTVDSMQFATRDELQQQISLLDKKFSTSEPNPEISRMEMKLDQLEKSEKKMEERLKAEIQGSQEAIKKLFDEKLNGFQTQSEAQLRSQIERLTAELSCIDQKVSQEKERNLQTVDTMQFESRDELQQQISLLDKKFSTSEPNPEISRMEMKLDQLEKSEKKMEERLKAEIQGSQEAIKKLWDEKLNGFQTQSEAQLRNQIERLTAELSCIDQKVSQEKERNLQTVDTMQFAIRDELQQQISLLDKKFSTSEPNPEISRMEMKLDQLEKSEKKMEEQLKAEIQGSQEAIKKLLDEKLNGFQTQSEVQLRNQIEQLTAELSCIDQKVSQEKERNLQTVDSMQFATRDELQQQISLLDKKFSTSEPNPEISRMEMKLDQLEKSEKKMEERLKAEIQGSQEAIKKLFDEKLNGFQTQSEAQLRSQIERLTAELSCIDQKVSQEKERNLQTVESMQQEILNFRTQPRN
ncbi:uncharacterized protein LOC102452563 [Pelodiscus sinensis]|uniref:uncharacterized protein LOC102452563 n=1 Tax=Pelodiscus sinensis TaxID=13735 RepID=UPI003F6C245E